MEGGRGGGRGGGGRGGEEEKEEREQDEEGNSSNPIVFLERLKPLLEPLDDSAFYNPTRNISSVRASIKIVECIQSNDTTATTITTRTMAK